MAENRKKGVSNHSVSESLTRKHLLHSPVVVMVGKEECEADYYVS